MGWRMVYVYLLPTEDVAGYRWFIGHRAEVARSVGADPVYASSTAQVEVQYSL